MSANSEAVARERSREAATLQAKADELLQESDYALYEEDDAIRSNLLADAKARLGVEEFSAARAEGAALTTDAAADLAERVLVAVGSTSTPS